jgi:hypothetical protein
MPEVPPRERATRTYDGENAALAARTAGSEVILVVVVVEGVR